MRALLIASVVLSASASNACPDLAGNFQCEEFIENVGTTKYTQEIRQAKNGQLTEYRFSRNGGAAEAYQAPTSGTGSDSDFGDYVYVTKCKGSEELSVTLYGVVEQPGDLIWNRVFKKAPNGNIDGHGSMAFGKFKVEGAVVCRRLP